MRAIPSPFHIFALRLRRCLMLLAHAAMFTTLLYGCAVFFSVYCRVTPAHATMLPRRQLVDAFRAGERALRFRYAMMLIIDYYVILPCHIRRHAALIISCHAPCLRLSILITRLMNS